MSRQGQGGLDFAATWFGQPQTSEDVHPACWLKTIWILQWMPDEHYSGPFHSILDLVTFTHWRP